LGLDDLVSTETAFVATATAAIFSPRTRETLRRGAVLGVAGVMKAGDVAYAAARGVARGVRSESPAGSSSSGNARPSSQRRSTRPRSTGAGTRRTGAGSRGHA
jgi:hypothetical protein